MLLTRRDPQTGQYRTLDVPSLTQPMLDAWQSGTPVATATAGMPAAYIPFLTDGLLPEDPSAAPTAQGGDEPAIVDPDQNGP